MPKPLFLRRLIFAITAFTLLVAGLAMLGWIFHIKLVLNIIPGAATMKFNTSLGFILTGIGLTITISERTKLRFLQKLVILLLFVIAGATLFEYIFDVNLGLDNLIVEDIYSRKYPGRMSVATALCFLLTALALWGIYSRHLFYRNLSQYLLLTVSLIALVAIDAFILQIPAEKRIFFLNSMALNTSVLFLLSSVAISLKNHQLGFTGLLLGQHAGSNLMRMLLPFIIIVPLVLSYGLLSVSNSGWVEKDFGIAMYTVTFILLSIIYITLNSVGLNSTDSERIRLENSLTESNRELRYFKQALDASYIVASTDAQGRIDYVNDNFCRIAQYDRRELLGKTHNLITSGYHPKKFFKHLWQTIAQGNVWIGDIKNKAKDGSYYWVHTTIVPFRNQAGEIYKYLAIGQDISQQKKGEALIQRNIKELEQKNKELEEFAYIASHDLQEPLRTVTSISNILATDYKPQLDEQAFKYLSFLTQATSRMRDLITGLHDYARIGTESKAEMIDCNELLEELKIDLALNIAESGARIQAEKLPTLWGYRTDLRLLFQNLLTNAIKFKKPKLPPDIRIAVEELNERWEFKVQDNGIGINEKHLSKIFVIFQRLHARDKFEGTGIGLAHCRKIVHRHGGDIWATSTLNEGSTFYFTIPITRNTLPYEAKT